MTVIALTVLLLTLSPAAAQTDDQTDEPTLVRLSYWVPPDRMAEFEKAYQELVIPLAEKHRAYESDRPSRPGPDGIFSRLFEFDSHAEFVERTRQIMADPAMEQQWEQLGNMFGGGSILQVAWGLYSAPAGAGDAVIAGQGRVSAAPGSGHWRTFDATNSPIQAGVRSLLQDRDGSLWIGTFGAGLLRYDGQRFDHFTTKDGLAHNYTGRLLQDHDGDLWIGTPDGLNRFDGREFTTYTSADGLLQDNAQPYLQDTEGNIWFGAGWSGLSRYDGESFTSVTIADGLPSGNVTSGFQDADGVIWFGTRLGITRFHGETFHNESTSDGPLYGIPVLQDRQGDVWIISRSSGGLVRYNGKTAVRYTEEDGLGSNGVHTIIEGREGNLWIGLRGSGVSRFDDTHFVTLTTEDGLAGPNVYAIAQGPEGHFWFGTGSGLSRYEHQTVTSFSAEHGLAADGVHTVFEDRDGTMWFGTQNGVSRYDGETITTFTTEDGLPHNQINSILQDRKGDIWFATPRGACRYDGTQFESFAERNGLDTAVYSLFEDSRGNLWFGGYWGVTRLDGDRFERFTIEDGLGGHITAILEDGDGNLWFGASKVPASSGGVSRYDGETIVTWSVGDGFESESVRSIIEESEGVLWLSGSDGRVFNFDGQVFSARALTEGSAGAGARAIFEDDQGHIWIGTDGGGVNRYDGEVSQTLTSEDGLAGNIISSITQDSEGNYWFGTNKGVTQFSPPPPSPPSMSVDAVVADHRYEDVSDLSVAAGTGLTTFEFSGANFKTRPGGVIYRYRLKNHDSDWQTTRARRVEYEDLPRGSYTFEVQSIDRDLVRSESIATVSLEVHHPYERIAFVSALGVALLLIAWQTTRVVRRDRRLHDANVALFGANERLEDQNRELITEQALERVRTRVAAMQESGDLFKVVGAVKEELIGLGVPCDGVGINVFDAEERSFHAYVAGMDHAFRFSLPPQFSHARDYVAHWREGKTFTRRFTQEMRGWLQQELQELRESGFDGAELEKLDSMVEYLMGRWVVDVPFSFGMLAMNRPPAQEPFSEEHIALLERFAEVFELGYQRYLDLQAAEARAREAVVDAALQRVRAEALSMRESEDLNKVLAVAFKEIRLHVPDILVISAFVFDEDGARTHYGLIDAPPEGTTWISPDLELLEDNLAALTLKAPTSETTTEVDAQWRKGGEWRQHLTGDELQAAQQRWRELLGVEGPYPVFDLEERFGANFPFANGLIGAAAGRVMTEAEIDALRPFLEAATIGYQRHLDFVNLEQANREIEEANQHKSQFLARMSHDLRTPMNAIIGYTRILRRRLADRMDEREARNLGNVETSSQNLLRLINEILDLSRRGEPRADRRAPPRRRVCGLAADVGERRGVSGPQARGCR